MERCHKSPLSHDAHILKKVFLTNILYSKYSSDSKNYGRNNLIIFVPVEMSLRLPPQRWNQALRSLNMFTKIWMKYSMWLEGKLFFIHELTSPNQISNTWRQSRRASMSLQASTTGSRTDLTRRNSVFCSILV